MTADERFALVLPKVDRAKKHLEDLRATLIAYKKSKPTNVVTRQDPHTRRLEYVLERCDPLPAELPAVVGDVLQNLRSALDHVAYQLVLVGTGRDASEADVYFPIANDARHFTKLIQSGQLKGARAPAIAEVESVQPHNTRNDALTRLQRLNRIDKHRALLLVGAAYKAMNLLPILERTAKQTPFAQAPIDPFWVRPTDSLFPMKAGVVLFEDGPDAEPDPRIHFLFDVQLGEPAVVGADQELLQTVDLIATEVERVVWKLRPFLA